MGPQFQLNATPLMDVLLVLLIFLVLTLPASTHLTRLDLAVGRNAGRAPDLIQIDIDADGQVYWNGVPAQNDGQLEQWLAGAAEQLPAPVLRLSPDRHARYARVLEVLAAAQRQHVARLAMSPTPD